MAAGAAIARVQTPAPPGGGARRAVLEELLTPDGMLVAQAIAWVLEGVARPDLFTLGGGKATFVKASHLPEQRPAVAAGVFSTRRPWSATP